jgi:hypothetical protein
MITWRFNPEIKQVEILKDGAVITTCSLGDLPSKLSSERGKAALEIRKDYREVKYARRNRKQAA